VFVSLVFPTSFPITPEKHPLILASCSDIDSLTLFFGGVKGHACSAAPNRVTEKASIREGDCCYVMLW